MLYIISICLYVAFFSACLFCSSDDVVGAGMALVLLAIGACLQLLNSTLSRFSSRGGLVPLLVYFPACLLCILAIVSPVKSLAEADIVLIIAGVLCMYIASNLTRLSSMYNWLVGSSLVVVVAHFFVIYYQLNIDDTWLPFYQVRLDKEHVSGIYSHRNYLGNFLAGVTCVVSSGGFFLRRFWCRLAMVLLSVILIIFILLIGSRGANLALAGGLLSIILIYSYSKWIDEALSFQWVVGLTFMGVGILGFTTYAFQFAAESRGIDSVMLTTNGRENIFKVAIELIIDKPLIGGGARSFHWGSIEFWPRDLWVGVADMNYAHNEYLQLIVDYGLVVGGGTLLSFIAIVCISIRFYSDIAKSERVLFAGAFSVVVVFLIQCMVSFPLHMLPNLMFFMVCLGLLIGLISKASHKYKLLTTLFVVVFLSLGVNFGLKFLQLQALTLTRDKAKILNVDLIAAQENLARSSNNFDDYRELGDLYFVNALEVAADFPVSMRKAKNSYKKAHELHPFDLKSQVALGVCYDYLKEFEKADNELLIAAKRGGVRERYLQTYRRLSQHYFAWALDFYYKRKPEEALFLFYLSRENLIEAKNFWAINDPSWVEEKKDIEMYIEFLERAEIKAVSPN